MAQYTGTETPLGAGTTYTSPARMSNNHDRVVGSVFSDTAGTLFIEQGYVAADGTVNWDVQSSYPVVANDGSGFSEALVAPKWRVRFTQAGNQTVFRLHAHSTSDGEEA